MNTASNAGHAADVAQTVVDLLVKVEAQTVRQDVLSLNVELICITNDPVQVKNDRLLLEFHFFPYCIRFTFFLQSQGQISCCPRRR